MIKIKNYMLIQVNDDLSFGIRELTGKISNWG